MKINQVPFHKNRVHVCILIPIYCYSSAIEEAAIGEEDTGEKLNEDDITQGSGDDVFRETTREKSKAGKKSQRTKKQRQTKKSQLLV